MIKLYCFGESGNAYKAALALELAGVDWAPVKVDFFGGETRTPEYRRDVNAMGEVPVMVDGGYRLTQSGAIQDYVVHLTGKLSADSDAGRREILRWILWDNHKLSSQAGMCRFLMNFLPADKRPAEVIAFTQGRLKAAYDVLNSHLDGRDFIVGDQVTIADLSCCGYLFYPEPFGFTRSDWPHIDKWLGNIQALPGWKAPYELMPWLARRSRRKGQFVTDAYIFDALRTPRGKGRPDGGLHEVTSVRLSAVVLNAIAARNGLDGHAVEDVIWGNVTQVGEQGGCLARTAVLASALDQSIPGLAINRFCASGLEAVNLAANQVRGGAGAAYIAGGVEMMGRVAMGSDGAAIAVDPSIAMNTYFVPQGISADLIATVYGFTRDQADTLAVESQRRAAAAWAENRFTKSIIDVRDINGLPILSQDEHMRPETDMQSLGALKASFKDLGEVMPGFDRVALMKYPHLERINHIHHAGNSSGIVDGAAALLIGSRDWGAARGLTPRARIRATAKIGTDPTIMLTGPVPVTEKILRDYGMEIGDIDLFEVNEAFASVVLRFMQAFDVEPGIVNVNGGSIAMGHPLGATGAIILGTLLDELERSDKEVGLATLCIASGMGAATIIERV